MSKLVKMLRHAHAGEIAAYHAYEGHWRSVSNPEDRRRIQEIQREELKHIVIVGKMLRDLGSTPSPCRDAVYTVIGKALSFLCFYTGWFLPMYGAMVIEKIGVASYWELVREAIGEGYVDMGSELIRMAWKEKEHLLYFENLIMRGQGRKGRFDL